MPFLFRRQECCSNPYVVPVHLQACVTPSLTYIASTQSRTENYYKTPASEDGEEAPEEALWKKGKDHAIPDNLSRAPVSDVNPTDVMKDKATHAQPYTII
ncbi:hypothetical protein OUZ56_012334 [Daphnia magna]|uniref:Uncharacterized protein n=1 Tax=Daphnia magna TaxID=35525 RepID=A0ABQ9Z2Q0_9CRUS|nr:hypothetical protein OUZ56_012334 [Daphnia magna]